jgi:hypothetical protein
MTTYTIYNFMIQKCHNKYSQQVCTCQNYLYKYPQHILHILGYILYTLKRIYKHFLIVNMYVNYFMFYTIMINLHDMYICVCKSGFLSQNDPVLPHWWEWYIWLFNTGYRTIIQKHLPILFINASQNVLFPHIHQPASVFFIKNYQYNWKWYVTLYLHLLISTKA